MSEVRTKRTVKRNGSLSSNGSLSDNLNRPGGLQRRGSSGSMTERTFRDPSPNGGVSKVLHLEHRPPVPALPRGYASTPPLPAKSTRRSASSEPPERSPKSRTAGRGVSLDRGPGVMGSRSAKGRDIKTNRLPNVGDQDHGMSRDSVNFSRPMSPQNSPAPSPMMKRHIEALDAPSASTFSSSFQPSPPRLRDSKAASLADRFERTKQKANTDREDDERTHSPNTSRGSRPGSTTLESSLPSQFSPGPTSALSGSGLRTGSTVDDPDAMPKPKKKNQVPPFRRKHHDTDERPLHHHISDSDTQSEHSISDRPRVFNSRPSGLLVKQPSIVREEPEAEDQEERETPTGRIDSQVTQIRDTVGKSRGGEHHVRFTSQSVQGSPVGQPVTNFSGGNDERRIAVTIPQHQSLGPSRAAHFSSQPILDTPEGAKHQPPLRSVSPAKSALKHSPSSRGPSPAASALGSRLYTDGRAGSEASDTISVTDDGLKGAPKKKKAVRVSFDDDSVVTTQAASPTTSPNSSGVLSSQTTVGSSNGWNTGTVDKSQEVGSFPVDTGSGIQPIPALPVFGSVRVRKDEGGHGQSADYRNSEYRPQVGPSTDLAIGDILAQHHQASGRFKDPVAPDVTSVEGTGYQSDSGDSLMDENGYSIQPFTANGKIIDLGNSPRNSSTPLNHNISGHWTPVRGDPVPEINILPATPGIDKAITDETDWLRIPGQFPLSTESLINYEPPSNPVAEHHANHQTPAEAGIAEPLPLAAPHEAGTTAVGSVADGLRAQIRTHTEAEFDDSDESIYSDAAEDLSDFEGDGFGSINAIVESPAAGVRPMVVHENVELTDGSAKDEAFTIPSRRGTLRQNESTDSEPDLEDGWTTRQAYGPGLRYTRKQKEGRASIPGATDELTVENISNLKIDDPAPKDFLKNQESDYLRSNSWPKSDQGDKARQVSLKQSAMKRSLRSSQPEDVIGSQMRSSMRNSVLPNSQRNSVQPVTTARPKGALKKKSYPLSSIAMADNDSTRDQKSTMSLGQSSGIPRTGAASSAPLPPLINPRRNQATTNLRRLKSSDSDSSSSFKRLRPSTADSNRYTMKRSMRSESADNQSRLSPVNGTGTYSVRSPSPNGRRPLSSAGSTMRTSMRGPIDTSKKPRTKSPSRFGFGKPAKYAPKINSKSGFSSRFADSSDEDTRPVKRRSRFEDSSDEDVPSRLTPVRGIPRRIDEGESTDLEDSSAEPSPMKKSKARPQSSSKAQNLQGLTLAAGSLRSPSTSIATSAPKKLNLESKTDVDGDTKKRSFFGGLGTKKRDASQIRISDRKDATLERPNSARTVTTESKDFLTPRSAPLTKPPKLQRRNTPKRLMSNSWPLPDTAGSVAVETHISGGSGALQDEKGNQKLNGISQTPNFGMKETILQGEMQAEDIEIVGAKTKKKRFPMLRKALRLNG